MNKMIYEDYKYHLHIQSYAHLQTVTDGYSCSYGRAIVNKTYCTQYITICLITGILSLSLSSWL